MNICFFNDHPNWGQLANCGGSRTILKSAHVLRNLGHKVSVVAHVDRFKWFNHPEPIQRIPQNTDALIAVSISDANMLLEMGMHKKYRMSYFSRPFEWWQIGNTFKMYDCLKRIGKKARIFCNSQWQVDDLTSKGIPCTLQYAGLDLDIWRDEGIRGEKIRIGSLYNLFSGKRWEDFKQVTKMLGHEYDYVAFGAKKFKNGFLHRYLKCPTESELRTFYSKCHIWFAPTIMEGFHNVPAEANLCGCLVVCNYIPTNGSGDYATDETAMIYGNLDEAVEMIKTADYSKVARMQEILKNKIGDRQKNMNLFAERLAK